MMSISAGRIKLIEGLMLTDRERTPLLVASTKLEKGLRAMTMKERLEVHRQIEAENERKLKEWKEDRNDA